MGLLGWFENKPHRNDGGATGDVDGRAQTRGPSRWLVYGFAALALLWVLGRVNGVLSGLGSGTGQPVSSPSDPGRVAAVDDAVDQVGTYTGREYEQALAAELETLLSRITGAGRVAVSVSLSRGPTYIFGHNTTSDTRTTEEKDSTGGVRTVQEVATSQQPVIYRDGAQGEKPLVAEEERPQVSGVLVLAEGAADSRVRTDLVRAVQALFPLPAHRVVVLPMGR